MKLSVWCFSLALLVILNSACDTMSEANEGKTFNGKTISEDMKSGKLAVDTCVNIESNSIGITLNNDFFIVNSEDENIPAEEAYTGISNVRKVLSFANIFMAQIFDSNNFLIFEGLYFVDKENYYSKVLDNVLDVTADNDVLYFIVEMDLYMYKHNNINFIIGNKDQVYQRKDSKNIPFSLIGNSGTKLLVEGNTSKNPRFFTKNEENIIEVVFSDGSKEEVTSFYNK